MPIISSVEGPFRGSCCGWNRNFSGNAEFDGDGVLVGLVTEGPVSNDDGMVDGYRARSSFTPHMEGEGGDMVCANKASLSLPVDFGRTRPIVGFLMECVNILLLS